jgi:hypothetical protein
MWGKVVIGHKCAESVQLNVIQEIWDLLEADSSSSLANSSIDDVFGQ